MASKNRIVIITGAAGGIGQALVSRFLQENVLVWACDNDIEKLANLKTTCESALLHTYDFDIADPQAVEKLFERIAQDKMEPYGLINNAGIYLGKSIFDYSPSEINRVISVNCLGAVYLSKRFAASKIANKKSGVIINVSSVSGLEGSSDAIYGLSKAAVIGLTKSCAMNFAPYIRVNAIAPGLVETPMLAHIPHDRITAYRRGELLSKPITPNNVADTAVFLWKPNYLIESSSSSFPTMNIFGCLITCIIKLLPSLRF